MSEIDYNAIPGTSHLVDVKHISIEKGSKEDKKGIILIPTPSDDPNDPLNWTKWRKYKVLFFGVVLYCFGGSIPGCCIYSILTDIANSPDINITVGQLNQGTGYSFLFLGLGNFFWLPIAQQYGKRPVYLISLVGVIGFNIWGPFIHSNGEWIASKILHGFFYAPIESLPAITICDMFFEHERATYMGVYGVSLFSSNYIAPMFAGLVNERVGWKWTIGISVIFCFVCTVFMFLYMEETKYNRVLHVTKAKNGGIISVITSHGVEKNPAMVETVTEGKIDDEAANNIVNQTSIIETDEPLTYPPEKTLWQKMSLTGGFQKQNHLKDYFLMSFKMVQFPIVLYSGFLYGASLFFYSILNTTESLVLSESPYNFSSANCGLAYASPVIFVFLCYPIAGWASDWIKVKIARKHKGISQAEDRLWVLTIYTVLGPASLILWGVGAAHHIHWFGIVIGLGLMAGLCVMGCISSLTYAMDSYSQLASAALVIVICIRNTLNFILDFFITDFIDNVGLRNTFIACAFICMFCIGTFLIMELTGHYWRKKTRKRYWKMIDDYRSRGVIS